MTTYEEMALVAGQNLDALVRLKADYGLSVSLDTWRPTRRTRDGLTGFDHLGSVEILATDGVVAWFLIANGRLFYGHKANFQGTVEPLFSVKAKSTVGKGTYAKHKGSRMKQRSAEQQRADLIYQQMLLED